MQITTDSEAETQAFAIKLAGAIDQPMIIALHGQLGTGKSVFARAFIHALGYEGEVPSPTFTLAQVYERFGPNGCDIWHVDAYRFEDPSETIEIGLEEAMDTELCLIEWPEKLGAYLPTERLDIHLTAPTATTRVISLSGPRAAGLEL